MYLPNPDQEGFPGHLRTIIILEDRRLCKLLKLHNQNFKDFFLRRHKYDLLNSNVCISKVRDNMKTICLTF